MVTSSRSMSDFAQTVSCDMLPQMIAASTARSSFTLSTSTCSAASNTEATGCFISPLLPAGLQQPDHLGDPADSLFGLLLRRVEPFQVALAVELGDRVPEDRRLRLLLQ